jgi:putative ABC transport system permease protein
VSGLRFGLRTLWRDSRTGELGVLLAAIVIAVTAMTAVGFFTDRVGRAIRTQASAVLAGDLELSSADPIPAEFLTEARARGLDAVEWLSFPTMAVVGEDNSLALIRAVSEGYPLRGELLVSPRLFEESVRADGIPVPGEAWAEPGLLARLGVDVGATLSIGESTVQVTRVLDYQPGQGVGGFAQLAAGLMVNIADVPGFDVIRPGSRITYRQLYAGDADDIDDWRRHLEPLLGKGIRMRGLEDAGEQITAAIDRAQRFLTLASLVTVILAAVATAMASRRYALRHLDTIALMKSLGATQGFIQVSTLTQLGLMILLTAAVGTALGFVGQLVLVALGAGVLNIDLPAASWFAGSLGLLTAATITVGFALPHLLQLKDTPPMRVLRRDLPPPRLGTALSYAIAIGALLFMIGAIVRDLLMLGLVAGGLVLVAVIAVAGGWLLVIALTRFRGAAGVAWRYGLANISRRGSESVVQIVAFALSLMVLLLLTLVRSDLLNEWQRTIPEDTPNYFLINIEPEQWPGIRDFFVSETGTPPEFLPFLRGRVTRVKGVPVDDYEFPSPRGANFVERETNLTWREELPETNAVQSGKWWSEANAEEIEASVEAGIARDLGIGVGDRIGLNVGGEDFEARVTSLRFVEWDSMRPNFFLMLSPGLAEQLPQTYIASVYIPPEKRRMLSRFIRKFPGVTLLDLEVILAQVRMIIERASMAVQYVFLFTLLAGITVLLAAIQVTRDERRFESAILRTLGAGRRTIMQGLAVEFTALGTLAGLLAAIGATAVGWLVAAQAFQLDYGLNPWLWVVGCVAGAVVVGVCGTLATRGAVSEPPVAVLRDG